METILLILVALFYILVAVFLRLWDYPFTDIFKPENKNAVIMTVVGVAISAVVGILIANWQSVELFSLLGFTTVVGTGVLGPTAIQAMLSVREKA